MLTKLVVKNVRSIESASISFEKSGIEYRNKYVFKEGFLNPVTFYGDNGSGKSILLSTLFYLTVLMSHESKYLSRVGVFPDIIAFNESLQTKKPVSIPEISYSFLLRDKTSFVYTIKSASPSNVFYEELVVDNKRVLKRKGNKYIVDNESYSVASDYSAVRKVGIEEYSESKETYWLIKKCYEAMKKVIFVDDEYSEVYGDKTLSVSLPQCLLTKKVDEYISKFSSMPSFKMLEKPGESGEKTLYMQFAGGEQIPYAFASEGVRREGFILSALNMCCEEEDCIVVVDEINKSIHPLNLKKMVDEFVEHGIQLVFSCHDTNLLRYLRPDQVYFAYFGKDLHSRFKRLNEIHPNIRDINNIESMYLKGVFDEEIAK